MADGAGSAREAALCLKVSQNRNHQLEELTAIAVELPAPKMLLGDLSCTSWSPHFRRLLLGSGKVDARIGFGLQPSWPADRPWLLRIPIDHTLASPDILVTNRRLGEYIGSDHLPIILEFQLGDLK